ncbi:MAG TPA: HAD-IA family hydrolase [Usitatibacter sp.]|nr:HAD-IA family hydrolase [Usitatibacter sp.]
MPRNDFAAVIFDLDGTLVDSAGEIAIALNRLLAELGQPPMARREVEALIGRGVRSLVERALERTGLRGADIGAAVERFEQLYAVTVGTDATLFSGVQEGLALLANARIPMGVVTNKPRYFTEQLLRRLGVENLFTAVVAGDDGIRRKPAGDMLLAAARELGCDIDSSLMIGDSENDILAARDAGCVVWCVPYGYNEGRPPAALDCDLLVSTVEEAARRLTAAPSRPPPGPAG